MNREDMLQMLDYNYWATDRVTAAAKLATEEELQENVPEGGQSIHDTLVHMLMAEQLWRLRCQGNSPDRLPSTSSYVTLPDVLAGLDAERQAMRAYVAGVTDVDLAATVDYHTTSGVAFQQKLWQILSHMINHGTQHRAEAALVLTELGYSPGDVDLIVYLRELDQADS